MHRLYTRLCCFLLGICAFTSLHAETALGINVKAKLPFTEYVYAEAIPLEVTLQNPTTQVFIMDDYPPYNQNTFMVGLRSREGKIYTPLPERSPQISITLKPGEADTFSVNLTEIFGPLPEGNYLLNAIITIGKEHFASQIKSISVVKGIEITSSLRPKPNNPQRTLLHTLLYWARNDKEYLFLRITEKPTDIPYGFAQLGSVVRIAQPQLAFDKNAHCIVTYQTSRDRFMQATFDSTGPQLRHLKSQPMISAAALAEADATERAMQSVERKIEAQKKAESGFLKRKTKRIKARPTTAQ